MRARKAHILKEKGGVFVSIWEKNQKMPQFEQLRGEHQAQFQPLKFVGVEGMYRDADKKGLSFRNYGEYLLLGGGSHRTGKKGGKFQELREFAKRYYPNATEAYRWAAQDCMSLDGIPYIGNYSKHTPNLYVAAGFGKWGMTNAMAAGMILTDLILGKENEFASVFSPSRNMIKPQLFINLGETAKNILTPTVPRCSHLGCALKWNPAKKNIDIAHK